MCQRRLAGRAPPKILAFFGGNSSLSRQYVGLRNDSFWLVVRAILVPPRGLPDEVSPTFSTRGVPDPRRLSKWTSWSKGLHYKSDVYFCSESFRRELMRGGGWGGSVSLSCSSRIF